VRIVLNTHGDDAGSRVCILGLYDRLRDAGVNAVLNDWDNYGRYDVAVFMAYDHDLDRARQANGGIRVALADPKQAGEEHLRAARAADFLMVSSVEQRDVFCRHNRNILVYYMFPPMPPVERIHQASNPIVIGYHGNRVHLEAMRDTVKPALEELGRRRATEFWALYNVEAHGRARLGMPDQSIVKVRHVQWTAERAEGSQVSRTFYDELARVDIGIVPNQLPIRDRLSVLEHAKYDEPELAYEPFDHLVRFKASCNPGRLYPFAQLGVPVVADFAPSASQFIRDGESGFIVSSSSGWFEALEALAGSAALRTSMATHLRKSLARAYEAQVPAFLDFCRRPLVEGPPMTGGTTAEEEFARYGRYCRPAGLGRAARMLRRLRMGRP
jgi:hypothetical protein